MYFYSFRIFGQRRWGDVTWDGLHGDPQETLHLALLAHDRHPVHQRDRVQQVTQVHKRPAEDERKRTKRISQKRRIQHKGQDFWRSTQPHRTQQHHSDARKKATKQEAALWKANKASAHLLKPLSARVLQGPLITPSEHMHKHQRRHLWNRSRTLGEVKPPLKYCMMLLIVFQRNWAIKLKGQHRRHYGFLDIHSKATPPGEEQNRACSSPCVTLLSHTHSTLFVNS